MVSPQQNCSRSCCVFTLARGKFPSPQSGVYTGSERQRRRYWFLSFTESYTIPWEKRWGSGRDVNNGLNNLFFTVYAISPSLSFYPLPHVTKSHSPYLHILTQWYMKKLLFLCAFVSPPSGIFLISQYPCERSLLVFVKVLICIFCSIHCLHQFISLNKKRTGLCWVEEATE